MRVGLGAPPLALCCLCGRVVAESDRTGRRSLVLSASDSRLTPLTGKQSGHKSSPQKKTKT